MADLVTELRAGRGVNEGPMRDAWVHAKMQEAAARIERLEAALEAWNSAVRIDVLMEGPRYMGVSGEAGRRAWELTRAALGLDRPPTD